MVSAITLVSSLLSAVAPKFLNNVFNNEHGEEFVGRVKAFVDKNVTKLDNEEEVDTAIEKIRADPVISQRLLEMLLDAERDLNEKRIADIQEAREFRSALGSSKQPQYLIILSFGLLVGIIIAVLVMIYKIPKIDGENKDLALQVSGSAVGFLTSIGGMFARNIGSAFDFWFGSSFGSKSKSDQIETILKSETIVADSPENPDPKPGNGTTEGSGSDENPHLANMRRMMGAAA